MKNLTNLLFFTAITLAVFGLSLSAQPSYKIVPGLGKSLLMQSEMPKAQGSLGFGSNFPVRHSLEQYCPPVKFQGENSYTCTGWAVAYAGHTIRNAILNNQSPPALVFDPMFLFNSLKGDNQPLCDYGVLLDEAIEFIVAVGSIPYQSPELNCDSEISAEMVKMAGAHRITGFELLYNYNEESVDDKILPIKRALNEGKPVLCNILTYFPPQNVFQANSYQPSFWYVENLWQPRPIELDWQKSHYAGPHNVVVVGYDDELYGGALRIMNSYGADWGDNGFFWIKYDDFYLVGNGGYAIY